MPDTNDDQELHAIQQIITALSELDSEARAPSSVMFSSASGSRRLRS